MFFVNENIPCKKMDSFKFDSTTEVLTLEVNLTKQKLLVLGIYKPPAKDTDTFLNELSNAISFYKATYDDVLLIGDFNMTLENVSLQNFCDSFNFEELIKHPTCFKGNNPSCIDHITTNIPKRFMKSLSLETGISDHHKMIMTIFRSTFSKGKSKSYYYRDYSKFDLEKYKKDLSNQLLSGNINSYDKFSEILSKSFDKIAPLNEKKLRFNNAPFMTKVFRKSIMLRSRLRNKLNKDKNKRNTRNYKKQRNYCVKLLRKTKKEYFSNINVNDLSDSKKFWKIVKPRFSNKCKTANSIILVEGENIIKDDQKIANTFNDFFVNITKTLKLKKQPDFDSESISSITDKFLDNESVIKIKEKLQINENSFSFRPFTETDIVNIINSLSNNKGSPFNDIPVKIMKDLIEIYSKKLTNIFNSCLETGYFPTTLKLADVVPIFKKGDNNDKENYRPVSLLPNFSKVFERLMNNQIDNYMKNKFSKFLTGFRKNHSTQNALLNMIEKWKANLNNGNKIAVLIMDLSKAFDTLDHSLLLSKLKAYGFDERSLIFLKSYLSDRFQRCKVGNDFSDWLETKTGVPQGSILGPLLFNIFINDIFYFTENSNLCNYADDNTQYVCGKDFNQVIKTLRKDFLILEKWFYDNYFVLNPDKCHFMTLGIKNDLPDSTYNNSIIKNCASEKLLGVIIDNKLDFKEHLTKVCKNANLKLNALYRISAYMSPDQHLLIINSYIKSLFNYCPLIWMFCNRQEINKINKIHERCLQLLLNNFHDSFDNLLILSGDISIHQRCINVLMIEIYKYLNDLSPEIMNDVFQVRTNSYNIRNFNLFETPMPHSNRYGLNMISYRANQLWRLLPDDIKHSPSLSVLKNALKSWTCSSCPCNICRSYVPNLGYLN